MFSTKDRDNDGYADKNCAETCTGAWWYDSCFVSNLNGRFYFRPDVNVSDGVFWGSWRGKYSVKETQLMIRTVNTGTSEAATYPPSTQYTPFESSSTSQTETNTLITFEQTFTGNKVTTSPPPSCTLGSTAALPLDISEINPDLCQNVTSDVCTIVTEMVPDYCECDADGIWTIIQKRFDGSVDFYRSWMDYKEGFGCLNGEYWLGNDLIHLMTSNASYTLKIVLKDWENVTKYAQYDTFRIADEADGYRLTIGGYSGDAGDSLTSYHNGFMFSTHDRDNDGYADKKCAETYTGAWWYDACFLSNLNGRYYFRPDGHVPDGIFWWSWRGGQSLKETQLMLRKVNTGTSEAATNPPSTLYTSSASISYRQTDTNTLSTNVQTFTDNKATTSPPLLCTKGSTALLPLDISEINPDLCLGVTSDVCNNMTELVPNYCECDVDGIWTIIQKRFDGSVDFYRNWLDYKEGFGCLTGEYWLGNDLIHLLTTNASYTLKIVLRDWENVTKYAQYDTFRIADEADSYRLTIGGYSGDAGDSLISYHNGLRFSTHDRDNDEFADINCAERYTGAWWYRSCFQSNLNGRYYSAPDSHLSDGVVWFIWHGGVYSLKETQLMIRKVNTGTSEAATYTTSTQYTPSESSSTSQTETKTLSTITQTFAVDNATSSPPLSCTIGSTAALPLDISEINFDLCQNVTSDVCTTMTEMVPDYCECDADGIWTIIQKRFDGSVDFYRSWMDYKEGFGCLNGEYWLGNDLIHLMTSNASYTLKIVLTDWENVTKFAQYDTFRISDEADGYRLTIGGYSGDAGDSLISYHNGFMFSTKDRDTGPYAYKKCAQFYTGAWWYRSCFVSNLNGRYYFPPDGHLSDGIIWWSWRHKNYSLKATKLMIKPN